MPQDSVRLGGGHIDFNVNATSYLTGSKRVQQSNVRTAHSLNLLGGSFRAHNTLSRNFVGNMAAVVVAIEGVRRALDISIRGFLTYDQGLIRISKTSGVTGAELDALGESLVDLVTQRQGEFRALPGTIQETLNIAGFAGQLGVSDPTELLGLTRAALALSSSTNIIGEDAIRTLGQLRAILNLNTVDEIDQVASVIVHLGNNVAALESEIVDFFRQITTSVNPVGGLEIETIAGLAATLAEAKERPESAATVIGRTLDALNIAASTDYGAPFRAIFELLGRSNDEAQELFQRFRDDIPGARDEALISVIEVLYGLPEVADDPGQLTRGQFLDALITGNSTNVRVRRTTGTLEKRYDSLRRNIGLANEAIEDQSRHFQEAGRFAESYTNRLVAVGNQIQNQGREVGTTLVPALTVVAEQYKALEVLAATAFGAFTGRGIRAAGRAIRERYEAPLTEARARRDDSRERLRSQFRRELAVRTAVRGGLLDPNNEATARALERQRRRTREASKEFVRYRTALARATAANSTFAGTMRRVGRGISNFLGGPIGLIVAATAGIATLLAVTETRAERTEKTFENLQQRYREFIRESEEPTPAQDPTTKLLTDQFRDIEDLENQRVERLLDLARLRDVEGAAGVGDPAFLGGIREGIATAIEDIDEFTRKIGVLVVQSDDVADRVEAHSDAIAGGATSLIEVRNEYIEFDETIRNVLQSYRQLRDALGDQITHGARDLALEFSLVGVGEADAAAIRRITALENQRNDALLADERAIATQRLRVLMATVNLRKAERIREDTSAFTTAEREANDERLGRLTKVLESERAQLEFLENERDVKASIIIQNDEIYRQERERAQLNARQILAQPPETELPDLAAARQEIDNSAYDRRLDLARRELELQNEIETARIEDPIVRAGEEAVREQRLDLLFDLVRGSRELELAEGSLAKATEARRAAEVAAYLADGNTAVQRADALVQAREEEAQAANNVDRLREQADALRELILEGASWEEILRAIAEGEAQLGEQTEETTALFRDISQLAESGVRNIEDAIVELATTGQGTFRDFANAIVADLLRIVARATVTAAALQALGWGPNGQVVPGTFASWLQGVLPGGATTPTPTPTPGVGGIVAHDGGIIGQIVQRRSLAAGLADDERLAILQVGEEVLTARDPRHRMNLPRFHDGGIVGGAARMGAGGLTIQIENRGSPAQVRRAGTSVDMERGVIQIVLDSYRNGELGDAIAANGNRR